MNTVTLYDHRKKAGNQGDVCKHVALVSTLDETTLCTGEAPFRFADLFAGYARNPIEAENEWPNGIGKIAGPHLFNGNRHVGLWATLSGLEQAPCVGGFYPGSSWFAMQVCAQRKKVLELSLWDKEFAPFADLKTTFPNGHQIFNRAAIPNEPAIVNADFVFIDPPDKEKRTWAIIAEHLRNIGLEQSVLIWLPIAANTTQKPPVEDGMSSRCRSVFFDAFTKQAGELQVGTGATTIQWAKGGRTIGCQLLYRVNSNAKSALRAALEDIARVSDWDYGTKHFDPPDTG